MFFSIYFRKSKYGNYYDDRRTTQAHQAGEVAGI